MCNIGVNTFKDDWRHPRHFVSGPAVCAFRMRFYIQSKYECMKALCSFRGKYTVICIDRTFSIVFFAVTRHFPLSTWVWSSMRLWQVCVCLIWACSECVGDHEAVFCSVCCTLCLLVSSEYSGQVSLSVFCFQFLNASLSFMRAVSQRNSMTWHECSPRSSEESATLITGTVLNRHLFLFFCFVFFFFPKTTVKDGGLWWWKWSWHVASAWMWKA